MKRKPCILLPLDHDLQERIKKAAREAYQPMSTWIRAAALTALSIVEARASKEQTRERALTERARLDAARAERALRPPKLTAKERKAQARRALKDKILTVLRDAEGSLMPRQVLERGSLDIHVCDVIEALDELAGDSEVVKVPGFGPGAATYEAKIID